MKFKGTFVAAAALAAAMAGTVTAPANAEQVAPIESVTQQVKAAKTVKKPLRKMIAALPKRKEVRKGYKRSKFTHWVDADRDCQNTRAEVLRSESKKRVTGACTVKTGKWVSMYDGLVFKSASKLDIDHMVPLAEAWDSGARKWSADTRKRFANDLRDHRSLIAVSASSNRSKGDRDPGDWLPERKVCTYITHWAAVKTRWSLSVSPREKRVLKRTAKTCANKTVKVKKAYISTKQEKAPKPKPKPKPDNSGPVTPSGWDCPSSHPIKGNASSMIYHMPGGSYYSRTNPEECFATEAAARAAGYRKSKA